MAPSGVCRVSDCTQHGLFFKRLDRHLKRVHPGITMEYLKTFPSPNPKERNIRQKSSGDRHLRRPCLVPGCRYYNIPVSRLSDHLRRRHTLTIQEHESLCCIYIYIYTVGVKSMSPVKYWTNIYNYTLYFHSGKQQSSILLFLDYIRIMT